MISLTAIRLVVNAWRINRHNCVILSEQVNNLKKTPVSSFFFINLYIFLNYSVCLFLSSLLISLNLSILIIRKNIDKKIKYTFIQGDFEVSSWFCVVLHVGIILILNKQLIQTYKSITGN